MSWIKRRGPPASPNPSTTAAAAPPPPVQMYNPNQHSNLQGQWQQVDLQAPVNNWYNHPPQNQQQEKQFGANNSLPSQQSNYWPQNYNQQVGHGYNQNTPNQYNQQYNQYSQQNQTGYYENTSYQQQNYSKQQMYGFETGNKVEQQHVRSDSDTTWNWGWGDEDNSNIQKTPSTLNTNANTTNLSDDFAGEASWNWSVEDTNNTDSLNTNRNISAIENPQDMFHKMGKVGLKDDQKPENQLTVAAVASKPNKFDNLTPQWSTESQLSQDSSDPLHTSESDKSHNMLSRSSTISESPVSGHDADTFINNRQDTFTAHAGQETNYYKQDSFNNLQQHENREVLSNNKEEVLRHLKDDPTPPSLMNQPPSLHSGIQGSEMFRSHGITTPGMPLGSSGSGMIPQTPPLGIPTQTPPLLGMINNTPLVQLSQTATPPSSGLANNPPISTGINTQTPSPSTLTNNPPPFPPTTTGINTQIPPILPTHADDSKNPYKRTVGISHKSANKYKTDAHQGFYQTSYPSSGSPFNQSVNLETVPDNSEQPDSIPQPRKLSTTNKPPLPPENSEIAPITDRNQYLETGHLSNFNQQDYTSVTESPDTLPPPGFTRMVLGQIEQTAVGFNQDEPPPGLSRMVLGQTGTRNDPVGLHRMIPGESSSPEMSVVRPAFQTYGDGEVSESELNTQVRSATIGADTPPVINSSLNGSSCASAIINRSETIGADNLLLPYNTANSSDPVRSGASSSYNNNIRETNADGANNLDETVLVSPAVSGGSTGNRRDSIEGQPQNGSSVIGNLVNSVRDLTVGENTTDGAASTSLSVPRRSSKQESTDSENEDGNRPKIPKDRRYRHEQYEKEKSRSRYSPSPEQYRDKKYDRRKYRDKRYEEDTDYYSDKERDRRRDDKDKRAEFDKKYSSLKKDKEKDRRRREPRSHREYGRDDRRHDFYSRYEAECDDISRSRPSSRSDSMHESYRQDRDRHREKERLRRNRDPFNPYMQGYGFDPYNSYYQQYQQYQYYENLRRTNPQAYAEWYRKYYQQTGVQQGYGNEDRASVHSGRSSANDELTKDRYTRQSYYSQASLNYYRESQCRSISGHYGLDESRPFDQTDSSLYLEESTIASHRLTPAKFATAHVKAAISSGHLVKILPNYPLDGQSAVVEVSNLHHLLCNDDEYQELLQFPGPLVKGVTHKKTIIEYCENKIRNAVCNSDISDVDSYILMWELLILLLRQNGMVVGTDIAELLMKDRKQSNSRRGSVISNSSSAIVEPSDTGNAAISETNSSSMSILKEEVLTNKFRDYLIYGSEKEALEWAMKHGLWGHALFLASKLDKRTYANVMTRFANGLPMNDPLQTLYQLLSGKVPAAVTSVADEKWGDWRPHLAMILSNTTQRPELDRKSITTLADTLSMRGCLYAAQFCYLMAQVGFSRYGTEGAKLVLLGSNHNKPFLEFSFNEAIQMTEVYEYACSLNDATFMIPEFQPYKYLLSTRLADVGLLEKAFAYLEKISVAILQNPAQAQPSLVSRVCELADRLKYCDIVEDHMEGDDDEDETNINHSHNSWLKNLMAIEQDYNMGLITHKSLDDFTAENSEFEKHEAQVTYEQPTQAHDSWQQQYLDQQHYQPQWQPTQYGEQQPVEDYQPNHQNQVHDVYGTEQYQEQQLQQQQQQQQQQFWSNQQQWNEGYDQKTSSVDPNVPPLDTAEQHKQTNYWNTAIAQQEEVTKQPDEDVPRPQISMPNQTATFNDQEGTNDSSQKPKAEPVKHKTQPDKPATTGWFGGIWNKLSLRPKNQMKLPDDKNPTIVWDENKKRWVNLEADGDSAPVELKPPPKMSDMFPTKPQLMVTNMQLPGDRQNTNHIPTLPNGPVHNNLHYTEPSVVPNDNHGHMQRSLHTQATPTMPTNEDTMVAPKLTQPNIFKLQRNRNIKNAYVDVFNPGAKTAAAPAAPLPAPDAFGAMPNNGPQMNFFIPAPISDPNAPTDFLTPAPIQHTDDNAQQQQIYQPQQ